MLKRFADIVGVVNAKRLTHLFFIYLFWLVLACGLSFHYFYTYHTPQIKKPEAATSVLAPLALHDKLNHIEFLIKKGGHADEDFIEKIFVVISLSFLWFYNCLTAVAYKAVWTKAQPDLAKSAADPDQDDAHILGCKWWIKPQLAKLFLVTPSIVPAALFVISMRSAYEPAVFVMALVAIYMAAEHHGELIETEEKLEHTGGALKEKAQELEKTMDRVLDADGLASWRNDVYELYKKAKRRVDAVIRYYDIDAEWWQCGSSGTPWITYRTKAKDNSYSLWAALDECEAKVQFVSNLPLPQFYTSLEAAGQRGQLFRNFLGLAWHLVVFDMTRESRAKKAATDGSPTRSRPGYLRIRICYAPCWMHVIDAEVFQVIERGTEGNSTVRQLTGSMHDEQSKESLSRWARHNVRQFAHRGGSGEEYVISVLRYVVFYMGKKLDSDADVTFDTLEKLLNVLGMQEFIEMPKPDFLLDSSELPRSSDASSKGDETNPTKLLSSGDARRLCIRVFEELIRRRFAAGICAVGKQPQHPGIPRLRDLSCEIL